MYQPSSKIIIRCPLLPFNSIYDFDLDQLPSHFQIALYLSSKVLWQQFVKRNSLDIKRKEKLEKSILKYWFRTCSRATPFGLHAGVGIINIGSESRITLEDTRTYTKHVRLDMEIVQSILDIITSSPEVRRQLTYYVNNSLYKVFNSSYRYVESIYENNYKKYITVSVERKDYLEKLLSKCESGANFNSLISILNKETGCSISSAEEYIFNLIENQLIVPDLEGCLVSEDPFGCLMDALKGFNNVDHINSSFSELEELLKQPLKKISDYELVRKKIINLLGVKEQMKNFFQTDLFLELSDFEINQEIISEIISQMEDLLSISQNYHNINLEEFKKKFIERYDMQEVPILEALDLDIGVGYGLNVSHNIGADDIVSDLIIPEVYQDELFQYNYIQHFAMNKYYEYINSEDEYIKVTSEELLRFRRKSKDKIFPNCMTLFGSLYRSENIFDKSNFLFDLKKISGPSPISLISRFSYKDNFYDLAKELVEAERNIEGVMYADIIHTPQPRMGNFTVKPKLYEYEIPYLNFTDSGSDKQILLKDVLISVRNGEVVLHSNKLNKRIIPRLSNAHDYTKSEVSVYKFLCDIQMQDLAFPRIWDWGALENLPHLPRVMYKNIILKKARWVLKEDDIASLPSDEIKHLAYFEDYRRRMKLPEKFVIVDGDNELFIDIKNIMCISLMINHLRKYSEVFVEEFIPNEENCIVHDKNGSSFTNEVMIPIKKKVVNRNVFENISKSDNTVIRNFIPGSKWLSINIYCGYKSADQIIKNELYEYCINSKTLSRFEKFFFIRYETDFSHIRIRFYNSDLVRQNENQKEIFAILSKLVDSGVVHKVCIDTYIRELERYKAPIIEETESLFWYDSVAILKVLNTLGEEYLNFKRLMTAFRSIDALLNDFQLDLKEKFNLLEEMCKYFGGGVNLEKIVKKQLSRKYTVMSKYLFSYMNSINDSDNNFLEIAKILNERSKNNKYIVSSIKGKVDNKIIKELLPSYIHMNVNRLIVSKHQKYELLLYDFLRMYYKSLIAIVNTNKHLSIST